ncbi:MAG TPA: class I SAM-dependent methyltransferase [Sphingomicrobium sp.]|jgi:SAM-dependent methyltransferase|nr:class I SAM-dependent methyltransferase [Sphingomicrobium sp.]
MAGQRHGYNVSVGYVAAYFPNMAPDWLDFCIRAQGFQSQRAGPSYRYADLGCGQGFHLCLLAAANPQAEFIGVDFDSEHIAHAHELASAGGLTNLRFVRADFLDLAKSWPAEFGTFDYIALQGILTWLSDDVRAAAFECVAEASKPGTVATFGYNTPPGWLSYVPFRHVAHQFGKDREANAAIDGAITMFRRLRDAKSVLFERLPNFTANLETMAALSPSYLTHEYLPDGWRPLWHSEVARKLRSIDFNYVGTANAAEALLPNALPPELAAIIREQTDDSLREDVQDIAVMQRFREDIFIRQPRPAQPDSLDEDAPIYLLNAPREGAPVHFRNNFGGLVIDYTVVADIVAALADGPKPVAALMRLKNPARLNTRTILLSMLDARMVAVGNPAAGPAGAAAQFNAAVARAAAAGTCYTHLAASALGSGAPVSELDLLLLDTWLAADREIGPDELARGVAQRLKALGRQLQFRGGPVAESQLQPYVARLAPIFFDRLLPHWRRLGALQ